MYFYLQTSELLSGKAFNLMSDILHFDVRNVSLKTFTEVMDAFRTAMSFRFFNCLTNNRIGFCLSQKEFGLYLGLKIV